ncbi:MAG TPA: dihydrofolate reductase family protein [Ktedonobacteraceae bacterium]|jgi:dihydrofolate reductase|nr:dihydrofolate reductase family protein [Ktedonobacteraceae bacterium]
MRKVRLAINVSLDGYVARPNGALNWLYPNLTPAQEKWTTAFLREIDTILIGHTTYLEQAAFWPTQTGEMADLMNSHTKIVFSSRLAALEWNQSRLAVSDVIEEIARLKREGGRDIYVTGGARLARSLSQRGLIDEYNLTIHPVLLGSGMPLFQEPSEELALTLVHTIPFETGAIQLIYQKASA